MQAIQLLFKLFTKNCVNLPIVFSESLIFIAFKFFSKSVYVFLRNNTSNTISFHSNIVVTVSNPEKFIFVQILLIFAKINN